MPILELTEEQVGNRQEVARPDVGGMRAQEGRPRLTRGARRPLAQKLPP